MKKIALLTAFPLIFAWCIAWNEWDVNTKWGDSETPAISDNTTKPETPTEPEAPVVSDKTPTPEPAKIDKTTLTIEDWDSIKVHYNWTLEDWEKFDSSYDRWEPLNFQVWLWKVVPWFDKWVLWMKIWEKKTLVLAPADAYWEYKKTTVEVVKKEELAQFESQVVKKDKIPNWDSIKVWDVIMWWFNVKSIDWDDVTMWIELVKWNKIPAQWRLFTILEASEYTVTLDVNHPLAWKTLTFEVEIVDADRKEEVKKKLEVFLMWYCPFWEIAAKAIPDLKEALKDWVDLDFHYIATRTWEGYQAKDFKSLHWVPEAEENIRQICIKKHYWNETLIDYMQTRYKNTDNYWKVTDAPKLAYDASWVDAEKINWCVENWEWWKLLAEDVLYTASLWIWASPTWLANNKFQFWGIKAWDIQSKFCKYNSDVEWCKTIIESAAPTSDEGPSCDN